MVKHHPTKERVMDIKRNGTQPSGKGPAEWFTGTVRIDPLFKASDPARVTGASVTFEPGARTAWFAPGEKHWHGATRTTAMTHIAIAEGLDGKVVDWMEHVSDAQYRA
jgi:quercetin dioxygenase-like cupin family protein